MKRGDKVKYKGVIYEILMVKGLVDPNFMVLWNSETRLAIKHPRSKMNQLERLI